MSILNVQIIYETHEDQDDGIVIKQSLEEGAKVIRGTNIVITVNRKQTTPPDLNTEKLPEENNENNENNSTSGNTTTP